MSDIHEFVTDQIFPETSVVAGDGRKDHSLDLLLCIAAPPMTKRTGEVIRICHSRGVPVVMLTTTRTQPIGQKATVVISCEAFGMPLTTTPTIFAAEMLVHAVAERCKGNTRTQRVEEMLREHNIDVWDPET